MIEKTEYRLDEYRKYENGKWGPWQKLDGGWREDERVELLPHQTNAEMIIDEHITGKIDDWKARKMLNKVLSRIREEINYPAFKTIKDKIEADRAEEIDRINHYLEKIEKKILDAGPLQTITPHSLETGKRPAVALTVEDLTEALDSSSAPGNTESGAEEPPESKTARTPDQEIKYVLEMLQFAEKVEFHPSKTAPRGKVFPDEYWIKTNSSVKDVEQFLTEKKEAGEIFIPDIRAFMKNHLKGKKGGKIAASFYNQKPK
jgi:hypothetical protein